MAQLNITLDEGIMKGLIVGNRNIEGAKLLEFIFNVVLKVDDWKSKFRCKTCAVFNLKSYL